MEVAEQDGPAKGWTWVAAAAPQPAAAPLPDVSAHAGRPAAGRGTQLDPDKSMRGAELATTPLARPTGIDAIDSFTSPVGLASLAAGGAVILRAGVADGAMAGAKAALGQATPLLKYEVTKTSLEKMGVPTPLAMAAAIAVSGYRVNGKHAPSSEPPIGVETAQEALARKMGGATPAPVSPASPVASSPVAPAPPSEPVVRTPAPPPTSESMPSAPTNPLPDQKALNEAALARRRAEYQAREAAPAAPAKFVPTPQEVKEYMRLIKAGKTHAEAGQVIVAQRELVTRYGLTTPTVDETKFPKGMRGKASPE